jgi:hypothetical protein
MTHQGYVPGRQVLVAKLVLFFRLEAVIDFSVRSSSGDLGRQGQAREAD